MKKLLGLIFLIGCSGTQYTLHEDNDIFKPTKNYDNEFSQGLRITADIPDRNGSTAYFFGNNFYTPDHKQLITYQPDDRPYSGYTYAGTDFKYTDSDSQQTVFGLTAGMVGPASGSKQFQNQIHRWLDQHTAKGWGNQIPNEIGIILKAERNYGTQFIPSEFDLVNTIGGNLGNVFTQAYGGSQLRFGYNLPNYFSGPEVVFPRLPRDNVDAPPLRLYLYTGPYLRGVIRNIFLDGDMFRQSYSINKYPFVLEGRLGFAIEYGKYKAAYTYIIQTKEYHSEEVSPDFGEITLGAGW